MRGGSVRAMTTRKTETMSTGRRAIAELLGTFWLVLGGCGSAVLAASFRRSASACWVCRSPSGSRSSPWPTPSDTSPDAPQSCGDDGTGRGRQVPGQGDRALRRGAGARQITAAGVLCVIASSKPGFTLARGFASNGFAEHSPGGYSLMSALVAEVVLTFVFLMVILGSTDPRAPMGFAPIPIGLALTLIHLIGIPVTNLSVNPARSTRPAVFVGGWVLEQLRLFWVAPVAGAVLAGFAYPKLAARPSTESAPAPSRPARRSGLPVAP